MDTISVINDLNCPLPFTAQQEVAFAYSPSLFTDGGTVITVDTQSAEAATQLLVITIQSGTFVVTYNYPTFTPTVLASLGVTAVTIVGRF